MLSLPFIPRAHGGTQREAADAAGAHPLARRERYLLQGFATIQAKCGNTDEYDVIEPDGKVHRVPRSALNKRVWINEAYSCFSTGKHHATWQT
jgi:hypothetical protein